MRSRSGGDPAIGTSRSRCTSERAIEFISPWVYGWAGWSYTVWMGPPSILAPAYITTTRSATSATTPRSWVMRISPIPDSAWSSSSSSMICACTVTSRAVVGSSAMSTSGSRASAMAIMIRCRIPPENSWG